MSSSKPAPRRNLSVSQLKAALKGQVDLELNGWEILGDLMVVEIDNGYTENEKKLIGEKIVELHPKAVTVINRRSIEDEYREPIVEILAGRETETIYRENGCRFKIDPSRVMFSFGNKEERKRMASISSEDETVVDMFSCVGQFTIPIAKCSSPEKVYAVEKNPVAFEYLKENVKLNKLGNVLPILGDCREVCPQGVADRVVMGYLFQPEKFLLTALNAIDREGTIHYHFVSSISQVREEEVKVKETIERAGFKSEILKSVRVKSYAPKRYHWVLDLSVNK
jgi:tRNA wybutosine-synthesizing protein 2